MDGRAQVREDYAADEVESPTASIAAILTVAQIAAAENRFIMVGDVGSAYLNASIPMDKPDKILRMYIDKNVANAIIKQDKSFAPFRGHNGGLMVRLDKALYGCIESACDGTGFSTTFLPSVVPDSRPYLWLRVLPTSRRLLV